MRGIEAFWAWHRGAEYLWNANVSPEVADFELLDDFETARNNIELESSARVAGEYIEPGPGADIVRTLRSFPRAGTRTHQSLLGTSESAFAALGLLPPACYTLPTREGSYPRDGLVLRGAWQYQTQVR